jgi:small nuclear ribonucleoprotein (snRNP)-like protein
MLVGADVIRMKTGRIFVGRILTIDTQGVQIEAFGEKITVNPGEILKTEQNFNSLKDQEIEITLKDNSVIRGKYKNYDSDVGLLVEIEFGSITVPLENVRRLEDAAQKKKSTVNTGQIAIASGYYFVVGGLSDSFSGNLNATVTAEFSLDFLLPGLYTGAVVNFHNMYNTVLANYSYLLFDLNALVVYRFLSLRTQDSFLKNLIPFVGLGAGVALPVMTYQDATSTELDLALLGIIGLDIFLGGDLFIRVNCAWRSIPQSSLWFHSLAVNAGIGLSF